MPGFEKDTMKVLKKNMGADDAYPEVSPEIPGLDDPLPEGDPSESGDASVKDILGNTADGDGDPTTSNDPEQAQPVKFEPGVYTAEGDPYTYEVTSDGAVLVSGGLLGSESIEVSNDPAQRTAHERILEQIEKGQLTLSDGSADGETVADLIAGSEAPQAEDHSPEGMDAFGDRMKEDLDTASAEEEGAKMARHLKDKGQYK